ncbi:MAG TPA: hypothetical protein VD993_01995 [Chitinophagaceae bacterium]|nr:hypothetical protein [Chitinophagaceae bacterium]
MQRLLPLMSLLTRITTIMHRSALQFTCSVACILMLFSCTTPGPREKESVTDTEEESPGQRDSMEVVMMRDPALGYVPSDRLFFALDHARRLRQSAGARKMSFPWTERGPVYDLTATGMPQPNETYTAGRVRAVLMDTLNDPTGNTVFCGGVSGGLWRCTNFLSDVPNWQPIDDYFDNMCIAYICQDPTQPNVLYFATGEATHNPDGGNGKGIWKSVDAGLTWAMLPATVNFQRTFRMLCDNQGNIYAASYTSNAFPSFAGIMRSKDGGNTWTNITPQVPNNNTVCTDLELSSTGRLHASFGYRSFSVHHFYTSDPANAIPTEGWSQGSGIINGAEGKSRMELDCNADTLYAAVTGSTYRVENVYKSVDGGANWTLQNNPVVTAVIAGEQGWYNLTVGIHPDSSNQVVIGGINAWISKNNGQNYAQFTFDGGLNSKTVHVDHHYMEWFRKGTESWVLIGCDGGVYFSRDGGQTFKGKNRNLAIKQFYACSMHPGDGSNYFLAGSQDNGSHKFMNPGLSFSHHVTGGDGGFNYINQLNTQIQFTSMQNNGYFRSTNGGASWTGISMPAGPLFINPFAYDDGQNILYTSAPANSIYRWPSAHNTDGQNIVNISFNPLPGGTVSALTMSPFTPNRLFVGTGTRLYRLDNANAVITSNVAANMTEIGSPLFSGYLNCINTGTSDNHLVAVFTNYGINNLWYTSNGGASWSAIDGDLPDIPVRWAVFEPGSNTRLIIGTEAGVYSTDAVDGVSTAWMPHLGVPLVRVTMLKVRPSDNTIIAATYGRGLFSAIIPSTTFPVTLTDFTGKLIGNSIVLNWQTATEQHNKGFEVERSTDGANFKKIGFVAGAGNSNVLRSYSFTDRNIEHPLYYYRLRQVDDDNKFEYSAIILVKNPLSNTRMITWTRFSRSNTLEVQLGDIESGNGEIRLMDLNGKVLLRHQRTFITGSRLSIQVPGYASAGVYVVQVLQKHKTYSTTVKKE